MASWSLRCGACSDSEPLFTVAYAQISMAAEPNTSKSKLLRKGALQVGPAMPGAPAVSCVESILMEAGPATDMSMRLLAGPCAFAQTRFRSEEACR